MSLIGKQIELGLSVEGTRGSAESTTSKWVKNVNANIVAMAEKVIDDNSQGRVEDSQGQRTVQKWLEGSVEGVLHADSIGYLFNQLYGAVSTSTIVSSSVYSHVFTVNNDINNDTLSVFIKDGDTKQVVYNGAMVNNLEISASNDDLVRFTADLIARDEATNTNTPSYDTEYDFIARDISVKFADTEGGLSSATAVDVKNLNITWNAGAIRDHVFGSRTPNNIYNSTFSIEGSFERNYDDDTYRDLWTGEDYKYMQIQIQGEADLGSGNNPSITILLNRVQLTNWDRSGTNDELVTETVDFKAFYNNDDSQQSKVTLQNATQDYDAPYA